MVLSSRVPEGVGEANLANDDTTAGAADMGEISGRPFGSSKMGRECESTVTQQQPQACNLPMLDYYLTFIHYFGFSINPNDDTSSRYLSIRVKRAAAFASSMRLHRINQRLRDQASGGGVGDEDLSSTEDTKETDSDDSLGRARSQREPTAASSPARRQPPAGGGGSPPCKSTTTWKRLRLTVKFLAIALTSFLALNHLVVLIDYVRQGSKVLTELLLEMRLVITKFSALIFVASWHRNQARVRQLIRLVNSTSVNILARETGTAHLHPAGTRAQVDAANRKCVQVQSAQENARLKLLNRRVLAWWLLCVTITVIHFSLSEAELKTAHHLWEWLDDYSLRTLSNATTSETSLFAMATFDNYIYTVHVYGTRLIGASIICIVCSFQVENIDCLTRHALSLLQASQSAHMRVHDDQHNKEQQPQQQQLDGRVTDKVSWSWWWPTIWGSLDSVLVGGTDPRLQNAGAASRLLKLDWAQQKQLCRSFYVLSESDWLQVERERHRLAPLGWLSSTLSAHLARLAQVGGSVRELTQRFLLLAKPLWQRARRSLSQIVASRVAITNRVTPSGGASRRLFAWVRPKAGDNEQQQPGEPDPSSQDHRTTSCGASTLRDYFNDYLARERSVRGARPLRSLNQTGGRQKSTGGGHKRRLAWSRSSSSSGHKDQHKERMLNGQEVELQLDSLARKYELIRTVNLRIDTCFGHILLSQYLFLFLMSCIDVVFFSLSFSTNTKTKYIIVSGMILLWLPYLLLYRYASDIGLASERLLTSVRRLARLALVLQLSAGGGAGDSCEKQVVAGGCGPQERTPPQVAPKDSPGREQVDCWSTWSNGQIYLQDSYAWHYLPPRPDGGLSFWPASTLWHYRHLFCRQPPVNSDTPSTAILDCATESADARRQGSTRRRAAPQADPLPPPLFPKTQDGNGKTETTSGQFGHSSSSSSRARIFNKLDHVFKPSNLSIVGIMTMNKIFLLDFAKIVITASVMTIQFITKR